MARADISGQVIHFTKGDNDREAFDILRNIIQEGCLRPSGTKIKGRYPCVCFTEAPLASLSQGLVNANQYGRYSLFGIIFDKPWLYEKGGRPVIYQPDAEYQILPEAIRWRHMRYEPGRNPAVDFTWEREWRINTPLEFNASNAALVVPSKTWANELKAEHDSEQDYEVYRYSVAYGDTLAEMVRESFPWRVWYFS